MNLPNPQSIPFLTLINDIEQGKIKIPQFQRNFVWSIKRAVKLMDSLIKGFPIGTFTIWKTKEKFMIVKNLGNMNQLPEAPKDDYTYYVLDGQQRLTSIYASIKGLTVESNKIIQDFSKIYVDLKATSEESIVITNIENKNEYEIIKLCDLVSRNIKVLANYPQEYHDKIYDYIQVLQSYPFSVTHVNEVSIETAIEMYNRINVEGKPLSSFEIMIAKTYCIERNFDLAEKYKNLQKRFRLVGYETLNNSVILQTIGILLVGDCSKASIFNLNKDDFIDIYNEAVSSIEMAIDYFRTFYRIPVSSILPYDALLIPFAYFFYNNKNKPNKIQQDYLQDFFWRVALSERYSHSQETRVTQDIFRIDEIVRGNKPSYDYSVNVDENTIISNGYFTSMKKSYVKAILCLYMYHEPKAFNDNSKINVCNDWLKKKNSKNYHHFFSKSFLKKLGYKENMMNNILNITIVDEHLNKSLIGTRPPSIYIKKFIKENPNLKETLKTHLIDDIDDFGIMNDDYKRFIQSRANVVSNELKKRIIF